MVHVLCFGNLLHGDDGFGVHVCRRLEERLTTQVARLFEVGLRSLDALPLFDGCRKAILVDALRDTERAPGSLHVLRQEEIPADATASGHACGVAWLMQALAATRSAPPEVIMVAAVVDRIEPFSNLLSPALASQVDLAADRVLDLLKRGHE